MLELSVGAFEGVILLYALRAALPVGKDCRGCAKDGSRGANDDAGVVGADFLYLLTGCMEKGELLLLHAGWFQDHSEGVVFSLHRRFNVFACLSPFLIAVNVPLLPNVVAFRSIAIKVIVGIPGHAVLTLFVDLIHGALN